MYPIESVVCQIGESPIWLPESRELVWIDAAGKSIYKLNMRWRTTETFSVPFDITAIARCDNNGWLCASKQGLFYCSSLFDELIPIIDPCSKTANLHLNDAVTAPNGKLWFGSMNGAELASPDGKLFQLDNSLAIEMDDNFSVANGIAFNPELKRAYCSNMFQRKVIEYQLNDSMTRITNKAVFVELTLQQGYPDGLTMDSSGNLFVCHWDCGIISYYAPNQTKIGKPSKLGEIDLPVKHATRCTFGGHDFKTLFVTTASYELTPEEKDGYPQSGKLFILDAPTQGRAEALVDSSSISTLSHVNESHDLLKVAK
ncbi:SMP-30/gluconolactonase/LRE family protein [Vibrio mytili]|uniref:SMP-30/gluconolactonase/LRE family protein n=1 Tax=Vibrio mytili TaxID=50718 RepID=UPI002F41E4EE